MTVLAKAQLIFASALFLGAWPVSSAQAEDYSLTLYNVLNYPVTSFKLREGKVTGFHPIKAGESVTVTVTPGNGKCGGWLVARVKPNGVASILTDVCRNNGIYIVSVHANQNGFGSADDLYIEQAR